MAKINLCLWCIPLNRHQRPEKKVVKHSQDRKPPSALPKSRPLALTPPLSSDKAARFSTAQETLDQSPSPLFSKLPLETRRLMYAEALGGKRFHMYTISDDVRLTHGRCRKEKNQDLNSRCGKAGYLEDLSPCWGPTCPNGVRTIPFPCFNLPTGGLLELLVTCRQVYDPLIDFFCLCSRSKIDSIRSDKSLLKLL